MEKPNKQFQSDFKYPLPTNDEDNPGDIEYEKMLEKEIEQLFHKGCPNRHHCPKDTTKCCYLVKNHCIIGERDEQRQ